MSSKERAYIYRYSRIDDYLYDSIVRGYIFFSDPNSFNDPFDTKLPVQTEGSIEEYIGILKEIDTGKKLTESQIEEQAQKMFENRDETNEGFNALMQSVVSKIGVACFSKINTNILMWSHYADKHKGICIKYDYDKLIVRNVMRPLIVKYKKDYPNYNYFKGDKLKFADHIIGTKSEDWSYEEEFRILSQVQGENSINKEAVVEVMFGCKSDLTKASIVVTLFKQNGYNPIFKKANKKRDSFAIYFDDLNP